MENELRATFMAKAAIEHGYDFAEKVYREVESMFVAMMRGENMTSKLESYLPYKMERYNGHTHLRYPTPEWRDKFTNIMGSDESTEGNTKYRTKMRTN